MQTLGIDNPIIYATAIPVLLAVNFVFKDWADSQDNSDFFDGLPNNPK